MLGMSSRVMLSFTSAAKASSPCDILVLCISQQVDANSVKMTSKSGVLPVRSCSSSFAWCCWQPHLKAKTRALKMLRACTQKLHIALSMAASCLVVVLLCSACVSSSLESRSFSSLSL